VTETEVRALLAAAVAYDNRRPSKANITAWEEAANRARWTFPAALDAIHQHYAESTAFLMPGHITARLDQQRDTSWPTPYAALAAASPADETTRRRIMAMVGDRFTVRVRRERKPAPHTAEHTRAREAARAELDRLRTSAATTPESRP